jgi:ABC-type lipoprotein release transport system permease subunit
MLALDVRQVARSLLFGVSARDALALAVGSATLLLVAGLAALLSGWRASRASPASVLRAE